MREDILTLLNACMEKTGEGRHDVFFHYTPHANFVEVYARDKKHDYQGPPVYTMEPELVYLHDQFYESWPRMVALIEKVKALV